MSLPSLKIEIRAGRVWIPQLYTDYPFLPCSKALEEKMRESYAFFFKQGEALERELAEEVLRAYGRHLFYQVIPEKVRLKLEQFQKIELIVEEKYSACIFELMFDGERFLLDLLPIVRSLKAPLLNTLSRSIKPQQPFRLSLLQTLPGFETYPLLEASHQFSPAAWLPHQLPVKHFFYNGFTDQQAWQDFCQQNSTEYLYFSGFATEEGVCFGKEQTSSLMPWKTWKESLKLLGQQGLKGVFCHFLHPSKAGPFFVPEFVWQDAWLSFVVEIQGNIPLDLYHQYFDHFFQLSAENSPLKAHTKSLDKIAEQSFFWVRSAFRLYYQEKKHELGDWNQAKKEGQEQVKDFFFQQSSSYFQNCNDFGPFSSFFSRGLRTTNWLQNLQTALEQNKLDGLSLTTTSWMPLEDHIEAWSSRHFFSEQSYAAFYNLFNPSLVGVWEKLLETAEGAAADKQAFLSDLWQELIFQAPEGKKQTALLLQGPLPPEKSFQAFLEEKKRQGVLLIHASYDQEPAFFMQVLGLEAETGANAKPAWHKHPVFRQLLFESALQLEPEESLKSFLEKNLNAKQKKLLSLLYLFRGPYPKDLLKVWLEDILLEEDFSGLENKGLIQISLDQKSVKLPSSYLFWFDQENFWEKKSLTHLANLGLKKFFLYKPPRQLPFSHLFAAHTNLAEFLALQGAYREALELLFHSKEVYSEKDKFQPRKMLLWGGLALVWLPHLRVENSPGLGARIWRSFFFPSLEVIPKNLVVPSIQWGIVTFSRLQVWDGYAYALTSFIECMHLDPEFEKATDKMLINLSLEALQTVQAASNLAFLDLLLELLKSFAFQKRWGLYSFLCDWAMQPDNSMLEFPSLPKDRKKDQVLLELAFSLRQQDWKAAEKAFTSYQTLTIDHPSWFEIDVLRNYAELLELHGLEAAKDLALRLWQTLFHLAKRKGDQATEEQALEHLMRYADDLEDGVQLDLKQELLKGAMEQQNFELVKKVADSIARLYYKLGDTRKTTYYYSISEYFSLAQVPKE